MERIYAVANQKGGVGKTTTAVNLGGYLARMGHNVLLVDMDPQGNASSGLGVDIRELPRSVYSMLIGELSASEILQPTHIKGLSILPSNTDLAGIEPDLLQTDNREYVLKRALEQLKTRYEIVLIDCPPNLGILTLNALCAASRVLIPLQTEYYALEGLTQLLDAISRVQKNFNPTLILDGVVLTMYDSRTSMSQQVVEDVRSHFHDRVYQAVIPRNVKLSEAPSFGQFIGDYAPDSTGAAAYQALAKEVYDRG
ncbi:MAG TPA: ParA family protein [Leptospiraceae bacterium]|jgi:chromosome partitioning protein|nr:ParA family protein [Leptospirales bacterium]HMU85572.1 ParA family protein [Leptospiraceae bacterium]HMW59314.1 ParA family protein [Leptospiraceae bacterium]HMX55902.1 ParA family protein [Leptospiraceae bacterium]HMY44288.1 ParA family protein [Leptospiraceae bacterium]